MRAWSNAIERDANSNHWVSKSEAAKGDANFKKLFNAALKRKGAGATGVRVGDIYAEAKRAVVEIRKVADTRGNKDGAIQATERKYLKAVAKAVANMAMLPKTVR
jgi:hypothetical protein